MGMSQTGCCCGTKTGNCSTCEPTTPICCLQVGHSGWAANAPILLKPSALSLWDVSDTCPLDMVATEICGAMEDHWHMPWADAHCLPRIRLTWKPKNGDCDVIELKLELSWKGHTATSVIEESRSWPVRDIVFDDDLYPLLVAALPDIYPAEDMTVTVRVCPEGYTAFEATEKDIMLMAVAQKLNPDTGEWEDFPTAYNIVTEEYYNFIWGLSWGGCTCSGRVCGTIFPVWVYDPYLDSIGFTVGGAPPWSVLTEVLHVPYNDCTWDDEEYFIPMPDPDTEYRVRIGPHDGREFDCGDGLPPDPPPYCKKARLCVMLSVPDEGETDYAAAPVTLFYDLVWNEGTQQYELDPTAVPGSKPYTIEITLVEDAGSLPSGSPAGARAWILTVTIKEVPSGTVVLEYTDILVLDCTEAWSWQDVLEVPIDPTEDWLLHIGTSCPEEPPPPECDPGCWPECVMCPTRKNLYAVLEGAPTCCVDGTYGLTWVPTGGEGAPTVGYYQLPSPVGGPLWDCGFIDVLRVSCVDLDSISVRLIYREVEGTVVDITRTLSVACSGGEMESSTIELPGMFGEEDTLCGYGGDVGGVLRIVSI